VYVSLGQPARITRLPASRIFVPCEIWYYDSAPALGISYALQFLFVTRRTGSEPRLYSPAMDTIRTLLNPQSSTRGMFPVNDVITEGDVRSRLNVPPAEDEVIEASLRVARGITGAGNDEILGRALSPKAALNRGASESRVDSRITYSARTIVSVFCSRTTEGARIADISVEGSAKSSITLQLLTGNTVLDHTETRLSFPEPVNVKYLHRYALPAGNYIVKIALDGRPTLQSFTVAESAPNDILLGEPGDSTGAAPFRFGTTRIVPSHHPSMALAQVESSSAIMWRLRTGDRIVWSRRVPAGELTPERISIVELPQALPAGQYELSAGDVSRRFEIQAAEEDRILISYNANLSAEAVESLAGRLSLARGDLQSAEQHFRSALALVDLARVQALRGDLDGGRATLLSVLERQPGNADALAALGYISAQLQDYVMAVRYFRKAQEIQPSPVLRSALEQALAKSAH
jgi:hypothetical protein